MSLTPSGGRVPRQVLALADDLSGAAETAAALRRPTRIVLGPVAVMSPGVGRALVIDLDTRHRDAGEAARIVAEAVRGAGPGTVLLKKTDSLLRGNLAAETAAYARGAAGLVIAPALPAAGRTVRHGIVHLRGRPLHDTDAWRAETRPAPRSVAAALDGTPTAVVPLTVVRAPLEELAARLGALVAAGRVPVCDAESDADLDTIAAAALRLGPGVRLMGSGGLAAALGRRTPGTDGPSPAPAFGAVRPLLVVVGTAAPGALAQIAQLTAVGARHVALRPELLWGGAEPLRLTTGPDEAVTVVSVDNSRGIRPGSARHVVAALARTVAAVPYPTDLVLTGGETARRVLDMLGVTELLPLGEIHPGAVHSRTPDGRSVVTRPGSFGDAGSLLRIARALGRLRDAAPSARRAVPVGPSLQLPRQRATFGAPRPASPLPAPVPQGENAVNAAPTTITAEQPGTEGRPLPIIAVTMGDGAGIGPEVIVPALLHPDTLRRCRPVVIGDAERLRQAAAILGADCEIVSVGSPSEWVPGPGRIHVVDLGLLPADLPWGKLSAVAGDAAYHYVRVAAELALNGEVQGICTAPLNKEALHAGGHLYPGHTELLAHLTGIEEVSMMLSTPRVKVIHVTTHIGLIDAVHRIEPGLVERTVRRGHDAMVRAGVPRPVIGVCGINPHAGENGLFGYGEEEEKIVPAIKVLRADGIDAVGPLPADTAFFLAARGDYDLIVAMYHDQGHGPVKVMGIEAGVNLTVGLPVIRTSVDHGTAFDIAGTGKAEAGSMVEALRQAAEMSAAAAR